MCFTPRGEASGGGGGGGSGDLQAAFAARKKASLSDAELNKRHRRVSQSQTARASNAPFLPLYGDRTNLILMLSLPASLVTECEESASLVCAFRWGIELTQAF